MGSHNLYYDGNSPFLSTPFLCTFDTVTVQNSTCFFSCSLGIIALQLKIIMMPLIETQETEESDSPVDHQRCSGKFGCSLFEW
jgi:hypothetical protein